MFEYQHFRRRLGVGVREDKLTTKYARIHFIPLFLVKQSDENHILKYELESP